MRTTMVNKLFLFIFTWLLFPWLVPTLIELAMEGRYLHVVELLHKYYQEMNDLYVTDVGINSNKMSKSMNWSEITKFHSLSRCREKVDCCWTETTKTKIINTLRIQYWAHWLAISYMFTTAVTLNVVRTFSIINLVVKMRRPVNETATPTMIRNEESGS